VEGDPVAIAENLTLPAQPATGSVTYVTLGGDGYMAPFAAYSVSDWQVTADASGGRATYTLTMDDRFVGLMSYASFTGIQGSTLDVGCRWRLRGTPGAPPVFRALTIDAITTNAVGAQLNDLFVPQPVLLPGGQPATLLFETDNVNGDSYFISTLIYLFNIDVRQKTPMGPLLWARGASSQ